MNPINYKLKTKSYSRGFTLVEMVVTTALVSFLVAILAALLVSGLKTYRMSRQSVDLENKAAQAMRDFEWQARAASKILTASSGEFTFLRFFDLDSPSPTKVRYFMDGAQFKIGLTEPVGVEPNVVYPDSEEKIDLIIDNVTNTELFDYFSGSNEVLTDLTNFSNIKMVKLSISLDKNGNLPPAPITETTAVTLRNMKDNL